MNYFCKYESDCYEGPWACVTKGGTPPPNKKHGKEEVCSWGTKLMLNCIFQCGSLSDFDVLTLKHRAVTPEYFHPSDCQTLELCRRLSLVLVVTSCAWDETSLCARMHVRHKDVQNVACGSDDRQTELDLNYIPSGAKFPALCQRGSCLILFLGIAVLYLDIF